MTDRKIHNVAASVRQRLLNITKETGEDFNLILNRYGMERLLFRLSCSEWRDQFLLKGALLFSVWNQEPHRPTRDADFLGLMQPEIARLKNIFSSLCIKARVEDGIEFDPDSVYVEEIRENNTYEGLRVKMSGLLDRAKISLQIDIGFGDVVTPDPEVVALPVILDHEAPVLKAYPIYTVVAEKLEAIVKLGMVNSRMKDFYDLLIICKQFDLDKQLLLDAIVATFRRRKTTLSGDKPVAFTRDFIDDPGKQRLWKAFVERNRLKDVPELGEVMQTLETYFSPILMKVNSGR